MLKDISDKDIIKGIQENDGFMIEYVYKLYYQRIKSLVLSFHNLTLVPDDVFQEGMVRVIMNIRHGKFEGRSSFFTYLSAICRNVCLKELRKVRSVDLNEDYFTESDDSSINFDLIELLMSKRKILQKECRKIIDLRFRLSEEEKNIPSQERKKNRPFNNIASILNIQPDNARQRFNRCLQKLHSLLEQDPDYHILVSA